MGGNNEIRTVKKTGTGEYVEKKSRFLGFVYPVESEEEITQILENMRKKYWDARHVCYAYVLGEKGDKQRFSDDGEPSGTAGKPMLEILTGESLTNILVIVVRYFGGVLLGTGGLVRAYSSATKEALSDAEIVTMKKAREMILSLDYNAFGKVQYFLKQEGLEESGISYEGDVKIKVPVPLDKYEQVKNRITDITGGTAKIADGDGTLVKES